MENDETETLSELLRHLPKFTVEVCCSISKTEILYSETDFIIWHKTLQSYLQPKNPPKLSSAYQKFWQDTL